MFTYQIHIEYLGTQFVGWQIQKNGLSVQEVLEKVLSRFLKENIKIIGSGRTDAGVHARGQVANFELEQHFDTDTIRDGINHYLRPQPVSVLHAEEVDKDFNSRVLILLILPSKFFLFFFLFSTTITI